MCQMLGVPVQGGWKACALAIPAFASAWEGKIGIMMLSETSAVVPHSPLVSAMNVSQLETAELNASYNSEQRKATAIV
jgi:hypothetical protein